MSMMDVKHECAIRGSGLTPCDVMFIGIAPGREEARSGEVFVGPSGQFLKASLKTAGYDLKGDCYVTNMCCMWNDSPDDSQVEACSPRLFREIKACNPKLIVGLGQFVNGHLFGGLKRGAVRWDSEFRAWTMYTYHPSAIIRPTGNTLIYDYMRDLMKIKDVVSGWLMGSEQWAVKYRELHSQPEAQAYLSNLVSDSVVSLDIETRYQSEPRGVLCVGLDNGDDCVVIRGEYLKGLKWPQDVKWLMQNGIFDTGWLKRYLGIDLELSEDTLLMSYSLDERGGGDKEGDFSRGVGIHGLKALVGEYIGAPDWSADIKGIERTWDSGLEGQERIIKYNALDAAYTRRLYDVFRGKQDADNVRHMYEHMLIPGSNALRQMHDYGVYVDHEELGRAVRRWVPEWQRLDYELRSESGVENLGSPKQLAAYLYDELGYKVPETWAGVSKGRSTNKNVLAELMKAESGSNGESWLKKLSDYRKIDHLVSTYVIGIEDDIDEFGRVHPEPKIHGTRTGRLAYNNPPIQTIPKHNEPDDWIKTAEIRRIFGVPRDSGLEIIEADYRQAELWVAWMLSGDEALLESLETGDFHGATAINVFDLEGINDPAYEIRRYDSKRVTFSILYGGGADNLASQFGKGVAYWQANINKWSQKYTGYIKYRNSLKKDMYKQGELVSVSGRKRRFWAIMNHKTLNEAVNYPIQTTGHDFLFDSLIKLQLGGKLEQLGAHLLYEVHDSLVIESPKNMRREVCALLEEVMCEPKFGLPRGLMIDIKAGQNWYDLEDV